MNLLRNKPRDFGLMELPTLTRRREEMERMFDRAVRDPFELLRPERDAWMPLLDVTENEGEYIVKAEVPGMTAKDVNVSMTGNRLTISGQKEDTKEEKREGFFMRERSFGSFNRSIEMPEGVDPDKIVAEQTDGLLTVKIGKIKPVKPRQIPVKGKNN